MELAFYDRAGRGRLIVTGHDRKDLLHRLGTNDVLGLKPGEGRPVCFLTPKGRLIDWTVVLDRGDDLLVLTANPERLSGHVQQYTITEDVTVRSYMAVELVVCGLGSGDLLGVDLEPWSHTRVRLSDVEVLVARVEPVLGEAYAVLAPDAVALRRWLAAHARQLDERGVAEARVRSGVPAFPNEINEDHNPWEAGLDHSLSLQKGCYVGQEVVARLRTYDKIRRRLSGLRAEAPLEEGAALHRDGEAVGQVTTAAGTIGLGYLEVAAAEPGVVLDAGVRVVPLPME